MSPKLEHGGVVLSEAELNVGTLDAGPVAGAVSLAKTLADRRINYLEQDFPSLIWYDCVPCSACFFTGSEP